MKKGPSWRPKDWRVGVAYVDKASATVTFQRGPGMTITVKVADECLLWISPGLTGLPMPEERRQLFIDQACTLVAAQALTGIHVPREVYQL